MSEAPENGRDSGRPVRGRGTPIPAPLFCASTCERRRERRLRGSLTGWGGARTRGPRQPGTGSGSQEEPRAGAGVHPAPRTLSGALPVQVAQKSRCRASKEALLSRTDFSRRAMTGSPNTELQAPHPPGEGLQGAVIRNPRGGRAGGEQAGGTRHGGLQARLGRPGPCDLK